MSVTSFGVRIEAAAASTPNDAFRLGTHVMVVLSEGAARTGAWTALTAPLLEGEPTLTRARGTIAGGSSDVFLARPRKGVSFEEAARKSVGAAAAEWKTLGVAEGTLYVEGTTSAETEALFDAAVEALSFALYRFEHDFGGKPIKVEERALKRVRILAAGSETAAWEARLAAQAARAACWQFARALGDRPANTLSPRDLVEEVGARLAPLGVTCKVLDEAQLDAQGFGGILAVGKGSDNPPRLGIYDYTPKGTAKETIVLVGKGITFDTGGYSIKPKQHHNEMKYDMCGAASVAAALEAIAREGLPVRVVGIVAAAENMVSARAQRPGDVYRAWNGKTVDVYNTDAEGRLLLADALAFAGTFAPKVIVDMATLTGGTTSIAGTMAAIVCSNADSEVAALREAGASVGEKWLHLEILPEAIADMRGQVSDYANMNAKWSTGAPTMYAAAFLQEFVPEGATWLHLDIANVAWAARDNGYASGPGANAYGARTLYNYVANRAKTASM